MVSGSAFGFSSTPAIGSPFQKQTQPASGSSPFGSSHPVFNTGNISIKLLINREKNKVLFAESDGDFVDVLFSLLTLPMGTIIRLLGAKSNVGSMDKLYYSVANLDKEHLKTQACFNMLNRPRNAYESYYNNLKIKVDDSEPTRYYTCPESDIGRYGDEMLGTVIYSACKCGKRSYEDHSLRPQGHGGFVNGVLKYIVTDDLQIMLVSTTLTAFSLLKEHGISENDKLGISENDKLEEQTLVLGPAEVLLLLERALLSDTPFTDVFVLKQEVASNIKLEPKKILESEITVSDPQKSKKISLKLVASKSKNKVLYAEAGANFLDFLFSFLTFPLGSVIRLLGEISSMGCIDNLYRSVNYTSVNDFMVSEPYRGIFLNPKLPQHFNCSSQLLNIDEEAPLVCLSCHLCNLVSHLSYESQCPHGKSGYVLKVVNPKSPTKETTSGGGFMKDEMIYMVTDTLDIKPLSPLLAISLSSTLDVAVHDIEERVVQVGEEEALKLLKASLTSKSVLNDVFALELER